jgi:putative endonuclease
VKGAEHEAQARAWLEARGLRFVAGNVRQPGGELDLVMRDGDTLAIIEVRKRSHRGYGTAAESVDARKRARIVRAATGYLAQNPRLAKLPVRFDVIAIDAEDRLEWIQAAFDAGD